MEEASVDLAPGLHRLGDADPARRAAGVAQRLGVTVRSTAEAVDGLLEGLPAVPVTADHLDQVDRLARRLARLSAVADRTLERATATMNERLVTAAGGLVIHPDTVRSRAAAVESARAELVDIERAIAELDAEPEDLDPAVGDGSDASPGGDDHRPHRGPSLRVRQARAIGAVMGAFGVGFVLLGAGVLPLWAALVVPLLAALWATWYLRTTQSFELDDEDDTGTSRLAEVAATTALAFGGAVDTDIDHGALRRDLLMTRRARAEEEVRVKERAWADLAGPEADVADVEEIVRRFDAQHTGAATAAASTAQVRASQAVRDQVASEWAELWESLGQDPPPVVDAVSAASALRARATRPVVLVGAAAERAEEVARVLTLVPVVAVELEVS